MELCGGNPGAGRCDCRGGGGCRVLLLAMVHGKDMIDSYPSDRFKILVRAEYLKP